MGLPGMINSMIAGCDAVLARGAHPAPAARGGERRPRPHDHQPSRRAFCPRLASSRPACRAAARSVPVLGITGTGGSGKSSLTDELVRRLRLDHEDKVRVAVIAIDPTRRRGGGALLGDRIRMNAIDRPRVYFRSLATRVRHHEVPDAHRRHRRRVPRPGAPTSSSSRRPASARATPRSSTTRRLPLRDDPRVRRRQPAREDRHARLRRRRRDQQVREARRARRPARRRRQLVRNREDLRRRPRGHAGVRHRGVAVQRRRGHRALPAPAGLLAGHGLAFRRGGSLAPVDQGLVGRHGRSCPGPRPLPGRHRRAVRDYHAPPWPAGEAARRSPAARAVAALVAEPAATPIAAQAPPPPRPPTPGRSREADALLDAVARPSSAGHELRRHTGPCRPAVRESLSGTAVPRCRAPPTSTTTGSCVRFLMKENLPGRFPFTAGVFPFKRDERGPRPACSPARAAPFRTNRRFHLPVRGPAGHPPVDRLRLGHAVRVRPRRAPRHLRQGRQLRRQRRDLDDMKALYGGFDLCDPTTSVSMTINGPAPTILAMFLNTAIDQQLDRFRRRRGPRPLPRTRPPICGPGCSPERPRHRAGRHPQGGPGPEHLHLLHRVRLGMMADIAGVVRRPPGRELLLVSISGYHIAEAGANPISQLAFTLANGFTYVEAYLARGMAVDDFAPNLSRSSSATAWTPSTRCSAGSPVASGPSAMRDRYGATSAARSSSTTCRRRVGRCTRRRSRSTTSAPRCRRSRDLRQLQQPAHQRLRRGGHHAHRRVGAPGAGDPARHQPRSGAWR
jgi:methylmalonyl-CoA mutase